MQISARLTCKIHSSPFCTVYVSGRQFQVGKFKFHSQLDRLIFRLSLLESENRIQINFELALKTLESILKWQQFDPFLIVSGCM